MHTAVSLLGKLVEEAGNAYDLCDDIVSKLGCCFQSYRQYMMLGTTVSVTAMNEAQASCTSAGVGALDQRCPCGVNFAYNIHAFSDTTFCSGTFGLVVQLNRNNPLPIRMLSAAVPSLQSTATSFVIVATTGFILMLK